MKTGKTIDQITEGFWWARDKLNGEISVIKVEKFDWDGGKDLHGIAMGSEIYEDLQFGTIGLLRHFDFLERIPEPA